VQAGGRVLEGSLWLLSEGAPLDNYSIVLFGQDDIVFDRGEPFILPHIMSCDIMLWRGYIMKEKSKEPIVPHAMHDTVRQEIIAELVEGPCSARDLSAVVRIPERDVSGHLEHIRKTIASTGKHLVIIPAECKKCGFVSQSGISSHGRESVLSARVNPSLSRNS